MYTCSIITCFQFINCHIFNFIIHIVSSQLLIQKSAIHSLHNIFNHPCLAEDEKWVTEMPLVFKHLHQSYIWSRACFLSSVHSFSHVRLFVTPWTEVSQASLSITNSRSRLKLMSLASVMPSNHLILCHPLLLPPSIFPSIRVSSSESVLHIRWPMYWSFSFSISPSNEYLDRFPLRWTGWISLQSKGLSRVFSNTTVQKHQFFSPQLSL